jgi:hypothetical protein
MSRLSRLLTSCALLVAATALTASPALARDRDHDRLPDKWEKRYHLNVSKDDSRRDRDRDGLSNYGEYRAHTKPGKKDSDRDGRRDGREDYDRDRLRNSAEIRTGHDPGDKDSDNDGVKDGRENAGKIVKLSDSSITIKLAVGGSLTARLGDDLVVDCATGPSGSTPGSDPDVPVPGEDAPEPGEDAEEPAEPGDEDTGDAPDDGEAPLPEPGADDEFDDAAFDDEFGPDTDGDATCTTAALKVGAIVHEAKATKTGSGRVLVAIELVKKRR